MRERCATYGGSDDCTGLADLNCKDISPDSRRAAFFIAAGVQFTQQGPKLVGTGAVVPSYQGPVALSADGNTAIVGGFGDNSGIGAAWVFIRSGGIWTQQGDKLVGSGAVGSAGPVIAGCLAAASPNLTQRPTGRPLNKGDVP
jgi:hypothetical protein